jgi:hypothetical protein
MFIISSDLALISSLRSESLLDFRHKMIAGSHGLQINRIGIALVFSHFSRLKLFLQKVLFKFN